MSRPRIPAYFKPVVEHSPSGICVFTFLNKATCSNSCETHSSTLGPKRKTPWLIEKGSGDLRRTSGTYTAPRGHAITRPQPERAFTKEIPQIFGCFQNETEPKHWHHSLFFNHKNFGHGGDFFSNMVDLWRWKTGEVNGFSSYPLTYWFFKVIFER